MEQVDQGKFSCNSCGKSYKWKPEFAGRKVKCKCGFTMTAPATPPNAAAVSDEPDLDAMYDLASAGQEAAKMEAASPTFRCPSCQASLEPGVTVCTECGFNLKTGSKVKAKAAAAGAAGGMGGGAAVATAGGAPSAFGAYGNARRGLVKESRGEDKTLDLYLPLGMIVVGAVLTMLLSTTFSSTIHPIPTALMHTGLKLVLGLVLLIIGGIFCVKWGEIAFGEPLSAVLKLSAFALLPPAVAGIISYLVHDAPPSGWGLVGFFLAFGMFFILTHYLFEWDMSEKWVVTGMATMVCMLGVPFLFQAIINGGSLPGLSHTGTNNEDAEIDYYVDELGKPKPARAWFEESHGRLLGSFTREDSQELLDGLYALGPLKGGIWVAPEGPQGAELYVKLPSDAKKRKAMYDLVTKWNLAHKRGPATDEGGKWMIITFLAHSRPQPP
jgi:hypothetical protein